MSVDTYLKGKNTSRYQIVRQQGLEILVAFGLPRFAKSVHLETKRFLFWRSFAVAVDPLHAHGPT